VNTGRIVLGLSFAGRDPKRSVSLPPSRRL